MMEMIVPILLGLYLRTPHPQSAGDTGCRIGYLCCDSSKRLSGRHWLLLQCITPV